MSRRVSDRGWIVVGFACVLCVACGPREIPVVAEDFSREGLGTIKIVQEDGGAPLYVGDGDPIEKGRKIPIIAYQYEADGALSGFGAMLSPFARTNPAVLDLTEADLTTLAPAYQSAGGGPFEITGILQVSGSGEFLIDERYIVYRISPEGQRLRTAEGGPFVAVTMADDAAIVWQDADVLVQSESGEALRTAVSGNTLKIMAVPRETLEITAHSEGGEVLWTCSLFPSFRGATEGLVTYRLED